MLGAVIYIFFTYILKENFIYVYTVHKNSYDRKPQSIKLLLYLYLVKSQVSSYAILRNGESKYIASYPINNSPQVTTPVHRHHSNI